MIRITDPDRVVSIATFGGKPWFTAPGTVKVNGDTVSFTLNRSNRVMVLHAEEIASVLYEGDS